MARMPYTETISTALGEIPNPMEALLINRAEPAHTIINELGGVRALSRKLGVSGAAVTRWQKAKTEADKRGCDGVIPEIRRAQIIAIAKLEGKVIRKRDFLKA